MTLRIAEEQNKQNLDFDDIAVVVAGFFRGVSGVTTATQPKQATSPPTTPTTMQHE